LWRLDPAELLVLGVDVLQPGRHFELIVLGGLPAHLLHLVVELEGADVPHDGDALVLLALHEGLGLHGYSGVDVVEIGLVEAPGYIGDLHEVLLGPVVPLAPEVDLFAGLLALQDDGFNADEGQLGGVLVDLQLEVVLVERDGLLLGTGSLFQLFPVLLAQEQLRQLLV
jgi:hypothetical protein